MKPRCFSTSAAPWCWPLLRAVAACWVCLLATAARGEVELPVGDSRRPLAISAESARHWPSGECELWLLQGQVEIRQGDAVSRAQEAVLWIDRARRYSGRPSKVIAYLEGGVELDQHRDGPPHAASGRPSRGLHGATWFGRLHTFDDIQINIRTPVMVGEPQVRPAVLQHGLDAQRPPPVRPVQHAAPLPPPPAPSTRLPSTTLDTQDQPQGTAFFGRSFDVRQRTGAPANFTIRNLPERDESVALLTGGINIVIDDVVIQPGGERELIALGRIDIETDQLVMWSTNLQALFSRGDDGRPAVQSKDLPLELYMEGNIVFRQADRVIYADRMYYNVTKKTGVVLDAELLTGVPEYDGLLRLKADVLQQVNEQRFEAFNAAVTSSRLGVPRYWFETHNLSVVDNPQPRIDPFTGQVHSDPVTGEVEVEHNFQATSRNNFVYVGGVPVLYWPVMATDLKSSTFYVDSIRFRSDRVFGQQVMVDWDLYQILGIREPPAGTEWTLSTDYLSDRGPALGTQFRYNRQRMFGIEGPVHGLVDAWGIKDGGLDDLGRDRRAVPPETDWRGRVLMQHRHEMPLGFELTAQVGLISDRNFLEQYFEREWDLDKDQITALELKQYLGLASWDVFGQVRPNDFFMETEWLPRADHYMIGRPVFGQLATWYAHSHAGYARLRPAAPPEDPVQAALWDPLYGEIPAEGVRAATRQRLDVPLTVGPVNVTPYVLGEAAFYQEDINLDDLTRFLGQAGVVSSVSFWKTDPTVQNTLMDLNGLSHKIVFESELLLADSSADLTQIPRYDKLDENMTEAFRRRFLFTTFNGVAGTDVPPRFSDRGFAQRTGMQRWVTAEATDIVDDQMAARLGVRQRLQTKRGLPGQERIIDWMTLDVQGVMFPDADRDNFGAQLGLVNYDYRWHVGDRLTILSDGYADFFSDGMRTVSIGGVIRRPTRGRLYLAYRSVAGPFSSSLLVTSFDYRLSRKWIAHANTAIDFGPTGNIGQRLAITRIGESALMRVGMVYDQSRNNLGLQLVFEPRFMPASRLQRATGIELPPVGSMGVE